VYFTELLFFQPVENAKSGLEIESPTKAIVTFSSIKSDWKSNNWLKACTLCGTTACDASYCPDWRYVMLEHC